MSADLLRPPAHLSPLDALSLSQQAPTILQKQSSWKVPWPLSLLFVSDVPEKWTIIENLFFSCLRTGDNKSAFACLEKLKERFGDMNERVMGLTGLYHEAIASDNGALENLLKQYEEATVDKPTNMVLRKRKIALLRSMGRLGEATAALVQLLDALPIDAEAWSELADLYFLQALYPQAVFSLEEVLLITPNAWNMHARLGEVFHIAAITGNDTAMLRLEARSMRSFCRSIELCDDYLRGYYGLKLTTNKVQQLLARVSATAVSTKETSDDDLPLPSLSTVHRLNELATTKLAEIIRRSSTRENGWEGYEESEIIAARELLDRDAQDLRR